MCSNVLLYTLTRYYWLTKLFIPCILALRTTVLFCPNSNLLTYFYFFLVTAGERDFHWDTYSPYPFAPFNDTADTNCRRIKTYVIIVIVRSIIYIHAVMLLSY